VQTSFPFLEKRLTDLTRCLLNILYIVLEFFGAFSKLRKATVSFVVSVCLSVCLSIRMEQLGPHWTGFREI